MRYLVVEFITVQKNIERQKQFFFEILKFTIV